MCPSYGEFDAPLCPCFPGESVEILTHSDSLSVLEMGEICSWLAYQTSQFCHVLQSGRYPVRPQSHQTVLHSPLRSILVVAKAVMTHNRCFLSCKIKVRISDLHSDLHTTVTMIHKRASGFIVPTLRKRFLVTTPGTCARRAACRWCTKPHENVPIEWIFSKGYPVVSVLNGSDLIICIPEHLQS